MQPIVKIKLHEQLKDFTGKLYESTVSVSMYCTECVCVTHNVYIGYRYMYLLGPMNQRSQHSISLICTHCIRSVCSATSKC